MRGKAVQPASIVSDPVSTRRLMAQVKGAAIARRKLMSPPKKYTIKSYTYIYLMRQAQTQR
jgi:hypothetical protein